MSEQQETIDTSPTWEGTINQLVSLVETSPPEIKEQAKEKLIDIGKMIDGLMESWNNTSTYGGEK